MVSAASNNPHTVNQWFDTSAFAVPPAGIGRFGNAGRGIIQGPGWILANLGVAEVRAHGEVRHIPVGRLIPECAEPPNLGDPVSSADTGGVSTGNVLIANGNAGKITQTSLFPVAGSPRTGMMGFRWMF